MASRSNQTGYRKRWRGFVPPGQFIWMLSDAARQFRERGKLSPTVAMGKRGEDLAHRYLRRNGFRVLARNYRPNPGQAEVDIVAQENDIFVFVEVKSRATDEFGSPDRAIGEDKERRIVAAAGSYAIKAGIAWSNVRFDTISIVFGSTPQLVHQRDAFFHGRGR